MRVKLGRETNSELQAGGDMSQGPGSSIDIRKPADCVAWAAKEHCNA
jgi:hypothetical protein